MDQSGIGELAVGLFGASTGAAAALTAAAVELDDVVRAIVSRGGRPDLCRQLGDVHAPVLLIVGGEDRDVLAMNRDAARQLVAEHQIQIVEGATHLFEEPGALDEVAGRAERWFTRHL